MRNLTQIMWISLLVVCSVRAQQEKGITGSSNWLNGWAEFKPNKVDYGEANQILAGNISVNTKLFKKNTYVLQGNVYVTNNAVLTIEPGTVIIGDYESAGSLIITKGASIIADGLETDPIIFTSNRAGRKAGDWGGLIILGDALINKFGNVASANFDLDGSLATYGGVNPASNSGILRYVRIEFAGKKIKGIGNFNSLFLGGVGNKTILENIMVSFSGGDSFEVFGGEPTLTRTVSFKSSNDDYKFNYGAQCRIDNALAIRYPYLSNNTGSRCMDIASYDKKEEVDFTKKLTSVTATNLTFINNSENIVLDTQAGLVKEAVYVAQNAFVDCKRTLISGFNPAVVLSDKIEVNQPNLSKMKFEQMYFNFCNGHIFTENNTNNDDLEHWYGNAAFANYYDKSDNKDLFIDFVNEKKPDFRVRYSKITASTKN